jgi:hypothetical protein
MYPRIETLDSEPLERRLHKLDIVDFHPSGIHVGIRSDSPIAGRT